MRSAVNGSKQYVLFQLLLPLLLFLLPEWLGLKKIKSVLLASEWQVTNNSLVMNFFPIWLPPKGNKEEEDLSFKVKLPCNPKGNKHFLSVTCTEYGLLPTLQLLKQPEDVIMPLVYAGGRKKR